MTDTEWPIPAQYQDNAQATLQWLELVRSQLGAPLWLTSLWRSASANAALEDSAKNSRHLTAQAVDFVPVGITIAEAARRWQQAQQNGTAPAFDQMLFETDHIHGDPGGAYGVRGEALVQVVSKSWQQLDAWIKANPAAVSALGVALFLGFRVVGALSC